ncbi:hypothetical protein HMPREF9946_02195 [Acetobacteraceae bacterium AT-5844]|nr:hypothetical protein HMPREF9946_02195 [Acetobacteraceae bacterium AT-5844]
MSLFMPASAFTERHGLFVALVGGTNSGKTFSAMRLARGIAGPSGKIAVLDTEGGRTLHLKDQFEFDVMVMAPPHRPERYLEVAQRAQDGGYDALVIDSFTSAWRGIGGVLDWTDEELEAAVERQRANADDRNWKFDEHRARNSNKMSASIRPKMAWKLMVSGFLGLRIPIIFAIRGEVTLDPDTKKEAFKAQVQRNFLFEVTVSFRLSADKKGVIDLSQPDLYKMEGAHKPMFRNGDLISEAHGAALAAWARGETAGDAAPPAQQRQETPRAAGLPMLKPDGGLTEAPDVDRWERWCMAAVGKLESYEAVQGWAGAMEPHLRAIWNQYPDAVSAVRDAIKDRLERLAASEGADA